MTTASTYWRWTCHAAGVWTGTGTYKSGHPITCRIERDYRFGRWKIWRKDGEPGQECSKRTLTQAKAVMEGRAEQWRMVPLNNEVEA